MYALIQGGRVWELFDADPLLAKGADVRDVDPPELRRRGAARQRGADLAAQPGGDAGAAAYLNVPTPVAGDGKYSRNPDGTPKPGLCRRRRRRVAGLHGLQRRRSARLVGGRWRMRRRWRQRRLGLRRRFRW